MPTVEFIWDKTGFPMVWVNALKGYIHFYPITKLQFETFICHKPDARFAEEKVTEMYEGNQRISPAEVSYRNFYRAFATGLYPEDATLIAQWYGDDFEVPTLNDWHLAYTELAKHPPVAASDFVYRNASERGKLLIRRLQEALRSTLQAEWSSACLTDQMLMRLGVLEWVRYESDPEWVGMGVSHPQLFSMLADPSDRYPCSIPNDASGERLPYYGVRLIRRKIEE